jgi:hypothetical protein
VNPAPASPSPGNAPQLAPEPLTDLTAGATQFGIRVRVAVPRRLLEGYAPIDPAIGFNTAGILLSLLAFRLAAIRRGEAPGLITACLVRGADGRMVQLDLEVSRTRRAGRSELCLRVVAERDALAAGRGHAGEPGPQAP